MIKRKKFIPNIKFNIPLKNHTSFKIGGSARYFLKAKDKKGLIEAIKWAKDNNLPFLFWAKGVIY